MIRETKENWKGCEDCVQVPPKALQCDKHTDTMLISLTAPFKALSGSTIAQLSASDLGLPPTPPCRILKLPEEVAMEEGYDSNGQLGLFLQKGFEAESNYCINEQPLELDLIALDSINETIAKTKINQNFILDNESINRMKVSELREEM